MSLIEHAVYSFDEYIKCITEIGNSKRLDNDTPGVLWSRGQRKEDWNLRPTLLRDVNLKPKKGLLKDSSGRAVEEELRREHYIAKNYHFFSKEPKSEIEWMEVMQHHGVKTRVLDWSESMFHSLIFALECFFDDKQFRKDDRIGCSPCVWILEPIEWNMITLKKILKKKELIDSCLDSLGNISSSRNKIEARMLQLSSRIDEYISMDSTKHLKGIFNLSSIVGEMREMPREELIWKFLLLFILFISVYLYG